MKEARVAEDEFDTLHLWHFCQRGRRNANGKKNNDRRSKTKKEKSREDLVQQS